MARRLVVINGDEHGYIAGGTFFRDSNTDRQTVYVRGASALPDNLLDRLVDENVEYVCLIESYKRRTSALSDWQDYGKEIDSWDTGWTSLSHSLMLSR